MGTVAVALLTMTMTVTPSNGGLLSPPQITINAGAGQQTEPHVDGDTAAYSNSVNVGGLTEEIRYFDFPTNTDLAIPNTLPGGIVANDLLSDIDQGRIVFTRLVSGATKIMLFDVATQSLTELAPAPLATRIGVAIGGQTVAFIDYSQTNDGNGELMVLNLATSVLTRITTDAVSDANPAVSPDGNVVTWERCEGSNCDVWRATWSGSMWMTNAMSSSLLSEYNPDTNGTQIVYQRDDSAGPTGTNVVVVPIAGGPEKVLEIPGEQFNPSIRGQLVAFESWPTTAGGKPDLYMVDLATNRLFQITNTPDVTESLNDITVLPGGEVRVVWQAEQTGNASARNIYAATFSLPLETPPTCTGSAVLEATRFYSPTRSVDGNLNFTPAMGFAIPAELPVVAGNAGNKKATLTIELGTRSIECEYRSGSNQSHPTNPAQLALASSYRLESCEIVHQGCGGHGEDDGDDDDDDGHGDCNHEGNHNHDGPGGSCSGGGAGNHGHGRHRHSGPRYVAGTIVNAVAVHLHIQNGDTTQPMTRIRLTLHEVCSTSSVSSPLEAGNAIDGPQAAGCSSSGASLTPFLVAFAFLALMLRRPALRLGSGQASIRLVTRQEQRRLPR